MWQSRERVGVPAASSSALPSPAPWHGPEVIFADEPTGNPDRQSAGMAEELLLEPNRQEWRSSSSPTTGVWKSGRGASM
jgi:hypothetical protein